MRKKLLTVSLTVLISVFVATGIIYAATHNVTSTLGGTTGDFFDVDGTMIFDSIKVGAQDVGGVTFFNGTIVNETTTDDANNPVTFGDNVRIDGRVYRGATAGTSDALPFIVNDNMEVKGTLDVDGTIYATGITGTGIISTTNIADGTIATVDVTDGAITQGVEAFNISSQTTTESGGDYDIAETMTMITGDSTLFCMYSGYGTTDAVNQDVVIAIRLDDEIVDRTVRKETMGDGNGFLNMTTSALLDVSAGEHTIELLWNTSAGATATMYANTLDCIELKK